MRDDDDIQWLRCDRCDWNAPVPKDQPLSDIKEWLAEHDATAHPPKEKEPGNEDS